MRHAVPPLRSTPDLVDFGQLCHALSVSVRALEVVSQFVNDKMSIDQPGLGNVCNVLDEANNNPVISEMLGSQGERRDCNSGDTQHVISLPMVEVVADDTALHEYIKPGNLNEDTDLDTILGY